MAANEHGAPAVPGLHHVTAICGDPQRNVDFYGGLLGLRLVKKTVNFDDTGTYHLYYGDGAGTPGTIVTFFAWTGLPPMVTARGRPGVGSVATTAFGVSADAIGYWVDRLAADAIDFDGPFDRFGDQVVALADPHGLAIELVGRQGSGPGEPPVSGPVPAGRAIRGIHGVTIEPSDFEATANFLTAALGFRREGDESGPASDGARRVRFVAGTGMNAVRVDLRLAPGPADEGRMGIGAVHHVAWRAPTDEAQKQWRVRLADLGFPTTAVRDRLYFRSIYFHEPGGVLFEIATDGPGFAVDEAEEELGSTLALPPWLEERRATIAARLPEVRRPRADPR